MNFSELSLVGVPADPMAKMQQVFAEFVGGLNKSASLEKEAENSFLEKFSFSIPCGNEKICETLFNVLTGYKKQGISDLSMDGSILKLSVEAKNEDLAKQKLEKISEEQGLGVEQPLEKEENLMPKEEIKPVEEQVEKKDEVFSQDVIQKCKELDEQYDDQENYVMFEIVDNNIKDYYKVPSELIYDQVSKPNMYIYLDGKLLTVKEYLEVSEGPVDDIKSESAKKENIDKKAEVQSNIEKNEVKQPLNHTARLMHIHKIKAGYSNNPDYYGDWFGDGQIDFSKVIDAEAPGDIYLVKIWGGSGYVLDVYLVKANDYEEAIDKVFEWSYNNEGKNNIIFDWEYLAKDCHEDYETDGFLGEGKPSDTMDYEEFEERWMEDMVSNSAYSLFARAENFFVDKVPTEYLPKEQNKSDLQEVQSSKTQSNEVKEVKAEEKVASKEEKLSINKKADSEQESSKTYTFDELSPEAKERVINEEGDSYMEWFWNNFQNDPSTYIKPELITKYNLDLDILELGADTPGGSIRTYGTAELKSGFLHNSFSNIIRPIVERVVKEAAKESKYVANHLEDYIDLGCGDMYWDSDYFAPYSGFSEIDDVPFSLSDDIAEALNDEAVPQIKKALEEIADNITEVIDSNEEYAYSEDNARDMSEANQYKYNEDGSFAKVSRFTRKLCVRKTAKSRLLKDRKPADKKASIEEPVNNVVNTVAEPVMDHIEAKPEVPAQPVPEVKEEVEEKKEEVKPSKDVKTKEDAVKVLEDVLKAGEEADVKELGKVLDFLKSDKKEEKKEEVKEEKVEEKAEPKKEEPVKEEKKAEVKEEAKPLFANVTRVSLLKTANLIDSKWVFHFKGTDKVACLSVKNLLPGVSEKVAYLTSKEFYNEMMDTLTKKQAFDGEAVKQIVANYNEKIKVGSDEAKSQVSKATSKAKNETDGKKVSDTSKAVDTKLTDDGKAQKQDKVNSKEDAGAIESATKKAPAETDIKVSAELEAKCKQLTAALEAKEAEVSQMKMQQELAAKTAKARQIVEKSIKCGLVQCNETFRQEELLKQASPLKAKEEAMKRTADSMVADLLALSDEELDKQASYLSNFKVEAEVKQLKPIKIEASCEQSEDEDLIKALGAEMW